MNDRVNCITCTHYYVTWDRSFPNGCRLFEFETGKLPSQLVQESTGDSCKNHIEKKKNKKNL
ncbi:MAG TPA: uracil-DNA glycosylase [Clostridia bacterium]|nr:uracil-DNA glycosylase [Clostridia bacterium]